MFPIALDLTKIPVLLVGRGPLLARRMKQLEEAGAISVVSGQWSDVSEEQFKTARIIMVAGLPYDESKYIVEKARAAGKLINVEDVVDLCDFYFTANVRRGDLLIAVSTGGASPTLARRVRDYIGKIFGEEWAGRTQALADARNAWRAQGKGMKEIMTSTDEILAREGWLLSSPSPASAGEGRGGGSFLAESKSPSLTLPPAGRGDKGEAA